MDIDRTPTDIFKKNQSRIKQISNAITKKIKESQKPAAHQRKKYENSKKGKYTP